MSASEEWVSVEDKYPEEGVTVLVWIETLERYDLGFWFLGNWFGMDGDEISVVSHWQTLIDPPKEIS